MTGAVAARAQTLATVRVPNGARGAVMCGCCGGRFAPRRSSFLLTEPGGEVVEICAECVLAGPAGAAGRLRARLSAPPSETAGEPSRRTAAEVAPWVRLLDRRASLLERADAFPLEARQAAVRETRERR